MIKEAKEGLYNDLKYTFILRQASKNEQAKKKKKKNGGGGGSKTLYSIQVVFLVITSPFLTDDP